MQPQDVYNAQFYQRQKDISLQAAHKFLTALFAHVSPRSMLDVGCGSGSWLRAAQELGVEIICGIDGNTVEQDSLCVPRSCIESVDLTRLLKGEVRSEFLSANPRFDLTSCLEVAEHLPAEASESLIDLLTRQSDIVLFSAALPHQEGCRHINCQNVEYWANLFRERGYICIDLFRPQFMFDDSLTAWWYGQNAFLYIKGNVYEQYPSLKRYENPQPKSFYHEHIVNRLIDPETSIGFRVERKLRKWLNL